MLRFIGYFYCFILDYHITNEIKITNDIRLLNKSSLVTQTVNSLPAMWETWVLFLGWEDTLEKGVATHSSIFA